MNNDGSPETIGEKIAFVEGTWKKTAENLEDYMKLVNKLYQAGVVIKQSGGPSPADMVSINVTTWDFMLLMEAVGAVVGEVMLRKDGGRSLYQRN